MTNTQKFRRWGAWLALACAGAVVVAASVVSNPSAKASAVQVVTKIDENSTVDEVLEFAQNSPARWTDIEVRGRSGMNGEFQPIHAVVRKPDVFMSEEGARVFYRNGPERWAINNTSRKVVVQPSVPEPAVDERAALEQRMREYRANDPTLMKPGDVAIETPLNDLINPSYYVRKELRFTAQSVKKQGVTTIGGRKAIHLVATFPRDLAKEDHVDVYVDIQTGILLGMVIEPLLGGDRFEAYLDEVDFAPVVDTALFERVTPVGFTVVTPKPDK